MNPTSTGLIRYVFNEKNIGGVGSNVTSESAAGIAAAIGGESAIVGCRNDGNITASKSAAGIAGLTIGDFAKDSVYLYNNINLGIITTTGSNAKTAGIVAGTGGSGKIEKCRNYGPISGSGKYGITADTASTVIKNLEAGCVKDTELSDTDPVCPDSPDTPNGKTAKRNFFIYGTDDSSASTDVYFTCTDTGLLNKMPSAIYSGEKIYKEISSSSSPDPIEIGVVGQPEGLDADTIKLYFYNADANLNSTESGTYIYDLNLYYLDDVGNMKVIKKHRQITAQVTTQDYFYDEISMTDHGAAIKPVKIEIVVPGAEAPNGYSAVFGLAAVTYKKSSVENTFNAVGTTSAEVNDDTFASADGEASEDTEDAENGDDHWSKQLFVKRNSDNNYGLTYERIGQQTHNQVITGIKNPVPTDISTLNNRRTSFITNGLDAKFLTFIDDESTYPNSDFVGE